MGYTYIIYIVGLLKSLYPSTSGSTIGVTIYPIIIEFILGLTILGD